MIAGEIAEVDPQVRNIVAAEVLDVGRGHWFIPVAEPRGFLLRSGPSG
jgi:hypothetical protein